MTERYGKFDIRKYLADYGTLSGGKTVPEEIVAFYSGKLPPDLIAVWKEQGVGLLLGGKFQFCIPSSFQEVVEILLDGDPDLDPKETHIVGYSAFGDLLLWNEKFQRCEISLRFSTMSVGKWDYSKLGAVERPLASVISRLDSRLTYHIDPDRPGYDSLFDEAADLVGALNLGQCYGFFPALALGGAEKIENVQIADAKVHFTMLAEMGPLRIRQMTERDQIEFIRYAGRQQ